MSVTIPETAEPVTPPLLGPDDPAPYEVVNPQGQAKCLLICDHAANRVPAKLSGLGLSGPELESHIAWDIGVADVTRYLAEILDAPAILANYSRLVIDVNRRIEHPTAIVASCEGKAIPGNASLPEQNRNLRIAEIYDPYHARVDELLAGFTARGIIPAVLSIHSFTPVFYKQVRPWEIGVLWVQDGRMAAPMIGYFRKKGFTTGDNEPYDGRLLRGTTLNRHADAHGLPNALVEIRNDLLETDDGRREWAGLLGQCCQEIMRDDGLFSRYDGPQAAHDPEKEYTYFDELIEKAKRGE